MFLWLLRLAASFDFVDEIALLSNVVDQARKLLTLTESECKKVGLQVNSKKTEAIKYNSSVDKLWKTTENYGRKRTVRSSGF